MTVRKLGEVEWDKDRKGHERWRVRATNGNIMADSGEGYVRHKDARQGKLTVTSVLLADLSDEDFYRAVAYRMAIRYGAPPPPAIAPDPDDPDAGPRVDPEASL